MKQITEQAKNEVNIVGKLLDVTFASGVTKSTNAPYERATMTVKVTQTYGGREETSEIPVSMFASQYTKNGGLNPSYTSIQALKQLKTAQNVGIDAADSVSIRRAPLSENNYITKSGQLVNGWQIRTSFINNTQASSKASFDIDIFIMDMYDETDRDGDTTGRLIVKGGIVQYMGSLDVIEFVVEDHDAIDYIQRNWNIHDTVNVQGRIRVTTVEEKAVEDSGSWGEKIPTSGPRYVRELVITTGSDEGKPEEFAYDVTDIKKAFNARKARIEQMQIDAKNAGASAEAKKAAANKYTWE